MKITLYILTVLCFIFLASCNYTSDRNQKKRIIVADKPNVNPDVIDFKISDCQTDCYGDTGKILISEVLGDTMRLRLGHWLNCANSAAFLKDIKINNTLIDVKLDRSYEIEIDEKGNEEKIYTAEACDCYFFIDILLKNMQKQPERILVNSKNVIGSRPN